MKKAACIRIRRRSSILTLLLILFTAGIATVGTGPAMATSAAPNLSYIPAGTGFQSDWQSSAWWQEAVPGTTTAIDVNVMSSPHTSNSYALWDIGSGGYATFVNPYDGECLTWDNTESGHPLVGQVMDETCHAGYTSQMWAGTGGSPDFIWNKWVENQTGNADCPWNGGYTQAVISYDGTQGHALNLACPRGSGGYASDQAWNLTYFNEIL
jgi:hypothetical protein